MGYKLIDLTGERFGMLTVLRRADDRITPNGTHRTRWICKCDCGNIVDRAGDGLRRGDTTSCGCTRKSGANEWSLKPLPSPPTVQNRLQIGGTYRIGGRQLTLVGKYDGFARFEDENGFHECEYYRDLEREL